MNKKLDEREGRGGCRGRKGCIVAYIAAWMPELAERSGGWACAPRLRLVSKLEVSK